MFHLVGSGNSRFFYIVDISIRARKIFRNIVCRFKNNAYICSAQGAQKPRCWPTSEKGLRCESGTMPVAVYPDSCMKSFGLVHSLPLAKSWEGATNGDESEDLPVHLERLVPAGYG